jgi:hypothetical protein
MSKPLLTVPGAMDHLSDCNVNIASDFIAQYTTRQEYRYADPLPDHDQEWVNFMYFSKRLATPWKPLRLTSS